MKGRSTYSSVSGLNKALRKLEPAAASELRDASARIATLVADTASGRASRLGSTARHVSRSITARRDRVPVVRLGGRGYDPALGAEFGGGRRSTTRQFQPWRGSGEGAGYFLWPTIRDQRDRIRETYSKALDEALDAI